MQYCDLDVTVKIKRKILMKENAAIAETFWCLIAFLQFLISKASLLWRLVLCKEFLFVCFIYKHVIYYKLLQQRCIYLSPYTFRKGNYWLHSKAGLHCVFCVFCHVQHGHLVVVAYRKYQNWKHCDYSVGARVKVIYLV